MGDRDVLPDNFKPSHYDLVLTKLDFESWTYQGNVTIAGELVRPTREIVLNTNELKLGVSKLLAEAGKAVVSWDSESVSYDAKKQRATIRFPTEAPPSARASISIPFEGILNNDLTGFYRSRYKPAAPASPGTPTEGEFHCMLSTMFEACDARRAFPCFDEPNLKATFDVTLEVPDDQVALSNMPVKSTTPSAARPGWKLVSFERTAIMSTYLLAWAVGDFEYLEAFTERRYGGGRPIPVRLYTTKGWKQQGEWALWHATRIIDFFSERFGIDYPLPKSDILAVHEFTSGAMENWGLVKYRLTAILFDEEHSEPRFRSRIAYVVGHELAHQWFGNLVTMDWWDELWLNEGFATWAGWMAADHFHPDWEVWPQFINDSMEKAFDLDAVRASHPIHVEVPDGLAVDELFDQISYLKGASMIRMISNQLGIDTFLKGIGVYLRKYAYKNAKTEALWAALSEVSGQDVDALMSPWIKKIGYPVLTVAEEPGQISIKQNRFLMTGDVKPEEDETVWWVPLGMEGQASSESSQALTTREDTIRSVDDDFYKLNTDATGFYRVNYPPARLQRFGTQLGRLSASDKIYIIGSAADMAYSGLGTTAGLLAFLQGLSGETHYRVLVQALNAVGRVQSIFGGQDPAVDQALRAFVLRLIEGRLAAAGWENAPDESFNETLLRKELVLQAVINGHQATIDQALSRFDAYAADRKSGTIPANLRLPIFRAAVVARPVEVTAFLKREWLDPPSVDTTEICLLALGACPDPAVVAAELLPFLTNTAPRENAAPAPDLHYLGGSLAANRAAAPLLWRHMRAEWPALRAKLGNITSVSRFVEFTLPEYSDRGTLAEAEAFFAGVDTVGMDRTVEKSKDRIRGRAAYRERDAAGLKEWLAANGYA